MARAKSAAIGTLVDLDLDLLDEDTEQPRTSFDDAELQRLAESVRKEGIKIPLQVVPSGNGRYRIKYGARRKRAAEIAGLKAIPCLVVAAQDRLGTLTGQVLENTLRADLPPQDDAAALLIIWLGRQVAAFGGDGNPPEGLPISERIATLTERLCQLARVPDLEAYAGGGAVKIPWKDILASVGRGDWSDDRRKQHIRRIKHLAPAVLDAIIDVPMSAATVKDLNALPHDEQQDVLGDAQRRAEDDDMPLGDALRAALDERRGEHQGGLTNPPLTGAGDPDGEGDLVLAGTAARQEAFDPDPALALLTTGNGHAPKLITNQVEPERGTPPLAGHDLWDNASFLVLHSGLEVVQTALEDAGPRYFTDTQAAQIGHLWAEITRRMTAALDTHA